MDAAGEAGGRISGRYVRGDGFLGIAREKAEYYGLDARIDDAFAQL
jgi:hypothetical protein